MLSVQQLKNTYPAEQVVLVLLARLYFKKTHKDEVEAFIRESQIKWRLVYNIAQVHGVRPFIYNNIVEHKIEIPKQFEALLKKDYQLIRLKNLKQASVTVNLINELKKQNITLIPYKGAFFAHSYYTDLALRESADIDFFVSAQDAEAIEQYFTANGFKPKKAVAPRHLKFYQKLSKDIVYTSPADDPDHSFSIEIHWRLMEKFSGSYPKYGFFKDNVQEVKFAGSVVNKLQPTYDFLAVVSNHFVKDVSSKFKYLVDAACLIRTHPDLDTQLIFATAKQYGFSRKLDMGLLLTRDILGVSLNNWQPAYKLPEVYLQTPLKFPLVKTYLSDKGFLQHSINLQDNNVNKARFVYRVAQYTFVRGYVDATAHKASLSSLVVYFAKAPFRLAGNMLRRKK